MVEKTNVITYHLIATRIIEPMAYPAIQSRPPNVSTRREQQAAAEQIALAMNLCRRRGVRLTPLRRQILELLWESARPRGAYELIEVLELINARPVAPPTVYRALEFLITQGFACKIESRNAFVPCAHPERCHERIFLICGDCMVWVELEDQRFEQQLADEATHLGFRTTRRVVEVLGTCANCITTGPA